MALETIAFGTSPGGSSQESGWFANHWMLLLVAIAVMAALVAALCVWQWFHGRNRNLPDRF